MYADQGKFDECLTKMMATPTDSKDKISGSSDLGMYIKSRMNEDINKAERMLTENPSEAQKLLQRVKQISDHTHILSLRDKHRVQQLLSQAQT